MIKECKKHGFYEHSKRSDGFFRCRKCSVEAVTKRRKKIKQKAVNYKKGCCEMCGYKKCLEALEFHHTDPSKKDFNIGYKGYTRSWESVKSELDKCILLCANCHREIHSLNQELYDFVETKPKEKKFCIDCSDEIYFKAKRCFKCNTNKNKKRKISQQELIKLVEEVGVSESGRICNVTHTTIRRWLNKKHPE